MFPDGSLHGEMQLTRLLSDLSPDTLHQVATERFVPTLPLRPEELKQVLEDRALVVSEYAMVSEAQNWSPKGRAAHAALPIFFGGR